MNAVDDSLADDLTARDPVRRLGAIARIENGERAHLSDTVLAALVACLGAESKAVQRRAASALAAVQDDPRVRPAVRGALKSSDTRLGWGAAYALGALDALALEALPALTEALTSHDSDVRWAAHDLIVRLGYERSEVGAVLMKLAVDGDADHRKMAFYCLRDLRTGGSEVITLIERALSDPDPHLRLAALSTLAHSGAPADRAAAIAARCLAGDPDLGVRRAAAIALGHLGDSSPAIIDRLRRAAAHATDHSLVRAARASLARLGAS